MQEQEIAEQFIAAVSTAKRVICNLKLMAVVLLLSFCVFFLGGVCVCMWVCVCVFGCVACDFPIDANCLWKEVWTISVGNRKVSRGTGV